MYFDIMVEDNNTSSNTKGKGRACRLSSSPMVLEGSEGVLQLFHLLVRDLGEVRGVLQGLKEELLHQKLLLNRLARLIEEEESMVDVNEEFNSSEK